MGGGGRWAGAAAQHDALAARLKELQRGSSQGRERWQAWCQRNGFTSFEPEVFEVDFIAAFFESLEAEGWSLPPLQGAQGGWGAGGWGAGGWDWGYGPQWGGKGGAGRWHDPYDKGGYKGAKGKAALGDAPTAEASEKIFVGGLPKDANESDIANHFSAFGEVADVVVKRDAAGQCKGFGFVTFSALEAAQKVVDNSETNFLGGKWLDCKFALPEKSGGKGWAGGDKGWGGGDKGWGGGDKGWGGGKGWGSKGGGKGWGWGGKGWNEGGKGWFDPPEVTEVVFVGALPKAATEEQLHEHFSTFGEITDVLVKLDAAGVSRGFAFVTFASVESARKVLDNYDNNIFEGKWVDCKVASPLSKTSSHAKGDAKAESEKGAGKAARNLRAWTDEDITEKVWIGGLPQGTREPEVRAFCENFGKTKEVTLKYNSDCSFRGFAFVTMETQEAATAILHGQAGHYIGGRQVECRPCAKTENFPRPSKKDALALEYDFGPTPLTCGIIRVRGLPPEPKLRDVFKLFFNFSTTRIRDLGGDDLFVEFSSKYEAERAYKMKKGASVGDVRPELVAATEEEFEEAKARLPPVVPTGRMAPDASQAPAAASQGWASGQAHALGYSDSGPAAFGGPAFGAGAGQAGPAPGGAFGAGGQGGACGGAEGGDAVDWTALLAAQNVVNAAPAAGAWWPGQGGQGQGQAAWPGQAAWQGQG